MGANRNIHHVESYEILSVCPATNMKAVYVIPSERQEGRFRIVCDDVHFLAVVKVTQRSYDADRNHSFISEQLIGNSVVGLDLCDGYFSVWDEASNFLGLIRDTDDASQLHVGSQYPLEDKP